MKNISLVSSRSIWCALFFSFVNIYAVPPVVASEGHAARLEDMRLRQEYRKREQQRRARMPQEVPDVLPSDLPDVLPGTEEAETIDPRRELPKLLTTILGNPHMMQMLPPHITRTFQGDPFQNALRAGDKEAYQLLYDVADQLEAALDAEQAGANPTGPTRGHAAPQPQYGPQPQRQGPETPPAVAQAMAYLKGPQLQQKLAQDPKALKPILEGFNKALNRPHPQSKPRGFWARLGALRQKLSPSNLSHAFESRLGQMVVLSFGRVGKLIRRGLVAIIGKDKIYELDAKGEIKRDPQSGAPLPKMVQRTRTLLDLDYTMGNLPKIMMSQMTKKMAQAPKPGADDDDDSMISGMPDLVFQEKAPNRWYELLHSQHNMFNAIVEAGMMRVSRTIVHSVDRLFVRPFLMAHLHIPEWKLSYSHYLLHMHSKINPGKSLLNPAELAEKLRPLIEHPQNFVQHRLPFNLDDIRHEYKNNKTMGMASLTRKIRAFMYSVFNPLIQQATGHAGGPMSAVSDDRWVHELKEIGLEFADGMRDNQSFTAHTVLGLARQANKRLNVNFLGKKGAGLPEDTSRTFDDDLKEIERVVTEIHGRAENVQPRPIQFKRTNLTPEMERKIVWASERVIDMFREFILPPLQGQSGLLSYPQYIRRLVMPRLAVKFMPDTMKQKLGIATIADAGDKFHVVEEFFDATFHGLDAIIDLIALIKELRSTKEFRGRYYHFGNTISSCLAKVSNAMRALGVPGDPDLLEHGLKYVMNIGSRGLVGSVYGPFEERRIAVALLKANITDKDQVRLLKKKYASSRNVDGLIAEIMKLKADKDQHQSALFGDRGAWSAAFEAKRELWASKLLSVHSGIRMILNLYNRYGIGEILQELDEEKKTFKETGIKELSKIFARKTTAHFVAVGVETLLGKLFKPLLSGITGIGATVLGGHNYNLLQEQIRTRTGHRLDESLLSPIYGLTKTVVDTGLKHGVSKAASVLTEKAEKKMAGMAGGMMGGMMGGGAPGGGGIDPSMFAGLMGGA